MKILITTFIAMLILSCTTHAGPYVIHTHNAEFVGKRHIATNSVTRLGYWQDFGKTAVYGEAGLTDHGRETIEVGARYKVTSRLLIKSRIEFVNSSSSKRLFKNPSINSSIKTDIRYNF
tara:strand:+ start:252 stop:608 length:357 start_codon:yes stop_codon:yes gene_type:complete